MVRVSAHLRLEIVGLGHLPAILVNEPAQRLSVPLAPEPAQQQRQMDEAACLVPSAERAGGDIGDMAQARMKLAAQQAQVDAGQAVTARNPIEEVNAAFGQLCLAYARSGLPIVTVLEGTVMGGGFGLACVSDVSLARDNVSFRLPETSLGIIPAQIAPFLVERLGYAEAKRLSVTGARVDAREALTIRLVHEVHADEAALEDALQQTLARILACGPQAIATTKRLLERARQSPAESLIDDAAALFAQAVLSEEGQDGTQAFMQKRKPRWVPPSA